MSAILRAAIIGTGRIGGTYDDEVTYRKDPSFYQGETRHPGLYTILPVNHAGAYKATAGFDLVAAANRGEEKLRAFGERWGVPALYTDFRKMLREEQPDVVSVCTQSPEKAEVTVAAAEAGVKAIVVEKAMARLARPQSLISWGLSNEGSHPEHRHHRGGHRQDPRQGLRRGRQRPHRGAGGPGRSPARDAGA